MGHVLITGSAGFIGRHLTARLENAVGWDRLDDEALELVLHDPATGPTCPLIKAVEASDAVVHLAGNADHGAHGNPSIMADDILAAHHVLEACKRVGRPVVVTSSAYAQTRNTFYGVTKGAIEDLCRIYLHDGAPVSVVRLFNVYGPGQEEAVTYRSSVVPNLVRQFLSGSYEVRSTHVRRDFVYIDEVVAGLEKVLHRTTAGEHGFSGIGSGDLTTIWHLAERIMDALGWPGQLEDCSDGQPEDPVPYGRPASIHEAISLGRPMISLKEGIKRTVEHMKGV